MSDLKVVKSNGMYQLINFGKQFKIIRVISEYDNQSEARGDLVKLLTNGTTEEELSKKLK